MALIVCAYVLLFMPRALVSVRAGLAQVLQQRRNHETFRLYRVDQDENPELARQFHVERVPTLYVVEGKTVRATLVEPRGCRDIQHFLSPWLS